jgi:hypothetical protein
VGWAALTDFREFRFWKIALDTDVEEIVDGIPVDHWGFWWREYFRTSFGFTLDSSQAKQFGSRVLFGFLLVQSSFDCFLKTWEF